MKIEEFKDDRLYHFREQIEFKETENKGEFEGVLVVYETEKLAHGIFRFAKDSLKVNDGKRLFALWEHMGSTLPVGFMVGKSDKEGFKVRAKLDLTLLENGNPVNPDAWQLYSLMKNMELKFDLSVGGKIVVRDIIEKDNEKFIYIKEFKASEGSICKNGSVAGSTITNVFNEGGNMNPEEVKALFEKFSNTISEKFSNFEKQMQKAETDEELNKLKTDFSELKNSIDEIKNKVGNEEQFNSIDTKFNALNEVIKTLKQNYRSENPEEYNETLEVFNLLMEAKRTKKDVECTAGEEITFAATEGGLPDTIKPKYVTKILERLQAMNPVLKYVNFESITDASLKITREELGLPTVGIVNGDEKRYETTTSNVGPVTIELFQWYVQPIFQNRLDATNYVGFVSFAIKRSEYALALFIADKVFNGSGTLEPLGILNHSGIATKEFDLTTTTGVHLDDKEFAKQLRSAFFAIRGEVAGKSVLFLRRASWEYVSNLQDGEGQFYWKGLIDREKMKFMGRPVELVESDDSGLVNIQQAVDGDSWFVFGDVKEGIRGIQNKKMSISLVDKITQKGYTKYWMEKGLGFGVQLEENFVIGTIKK